MSSGEEKEKCQVGKRKTEVSGRKGLKCQVGKRRTEVSSGEEKD